MYLIVVAFVFVMAGLFLWMEQNLVAMQGSGRTDPDMQLPYPSKADSLSRAERSFYHVLRLAVGERAVVCPKVLLGDLFYVASPENGPSVLDSISEKYADFVLCDPRTLQPLAGIDLDGASHQREDRTEQDILVDRIYEAAGLPLLHFPARAAYTVREIARKVGRVLNPGPAPAVAATRIVSLPSRTTPTCPK